MKPETYFDVPAQVLSVIFRINGCQFAAATRLLPYGPSKEQAAQALATFKEFLCGKIPMKPAKELKAPATAFKWREYRQSTKQLLSGLANAIGQTMPDNFTLLAFRPDTILKPCPVTGTRVALTEMEKSALGLDPEIWRNLKIHMIHDHKTLERRLDFYPRDSSFHKLAMSADEGTEAGMDGKT